MKTSVSSASERVLIGAIINGDARALDSGLRERDFSDDFCRSVFALCLRLETQGKTADLVTLTDIAPELDSSALIDLSSEAAPVGSLAGQHADTIRGVSQRRRASAALLKAAQAAQDAAQPLEETINKLRVYLDDLGAQAASSDFVDGVDALCDFHLTLESETPERAISTGLPRLDTHLGGGLKAGRLYVIGARTSVGKSALMGFIATNAIRNGARVLYVSLEMGARENVMRMVASVSGVSLGRLSNVSALSGGDFGAITDAYALLPGDNFRFSTKARTPDAIRRAALAMKAQRGLDLIVVDYLQILQPDGKTSSRVEALGQITGALKLLAMELDIPILSAAQINRAGVQGGGAPRLSDLRESGSIEQDADVVILLHRPDGQEQHAEKKLEIAVAKNRQGSCGCSKLLFDGARMRYKEIS